jgi:hypothetical protein
MHLWIHPLQQQCSSRKIVGLAPEKVHQHETCKVLIIFSDAYMQSGGKDAVVTPAMKRSSAV